MVTLSVLGSGSRGNATFIKTDTVRILIDAGLSRRELAKRLESIGEDPDGIDAVLITHEHNDHGAGLRTLLKELSIKAYLTPGTLKGLQPETFETEGSEIVLIAAGVPFTVGDTQIMKATVIVTLKPTVLDPQGMTIQRSVASIGLPEVADVRQGKYFDVNLADGISPDRGKEVVQKLAKEVLTNPVIEEFRIVWEPR